MEPSQPAPDWYNLGPDEEVYVVTHPHPYRYWAEILLGLGIVGAGIAVVFTSLLNFLPMALQIRAGAVAALFGILLMVFEYLKYKTTWYIVTSQTIKKRDGFFSGWRRHDDPIQVIEVADHEMHQNPVQMLFGTGDIFLYSSGGTNDVDILLHDIPRAEQVRDLIMNLKQTHTRKMQNSGGEQSEERSGDDADNH